MKKKSNVASVIKKAVIKKETLNAFTKDKLQEIAKQCNITVNKKMQKIDLVALIRGNVY